MNELKGTDVLIVYESLRGLTELQLSTLLLSVDQDLDDFKGPGITNNQIVLAICKTANRRMWILPLMERARTDLGVNNLDPLISKLTDSGGSGMNPYSSLVMIDRIPFLCRRTLRTHLQYLNSGDNRVLCIDGDPDTGKSYTRAFVQNAERVLRSRSSQNGGNPETFVSIDVDLAEQVRANEPVEFNALMLAQIIAAQLPSMRLPTTQIQAFVRQSEQPAAWIRDFLRWIATELERDDETYWILVDGFREGLLDEGAQQLVEELIAAVLNEDDSSRTQLPSVRLLLMDYDPVQLNQYASGWATDETQDLTTLGSHLLDQIHKYFFEATPDSFKHLPELQKLDKLVEARTEVENAIKNSDKPSNQALAEALVNQVNSLEAGP